jgi:alpha-D-xyloside xylohydrolase
MGGMCISGADNEIWSFGEEVESILVVYLQLRERLRPHIRTQMRQAHQAGTPLMRPLCYDFPDDKYAWQIEDAYMFGPDILVAPVTSEGYASAPSICLAAVNGAITPAARSLTEDRR